MHVNKNNVNNYSFNFSLLVNKCLLVSKNKTL